MVDTSWDRPGVDPESFFCASGGHVAPEEHSTATSISWRLQQEADRCATELQLEPALETWDIGNAHGAFVEVAGQGSRALAPIIPTRQTVIATRQELLQLHNSQPLAQQLHTSQQLPQPLHQSQPLKQQLHTSQPLSQQLHNNGKVTTRQEGVMAESQQLSQRLHSLQSPRTQLHPSQPPTMQQLHPSQSPSQQLHHKPRAPTMQNKISSHDTTRQDAVTSSSSASSSLHSSQPAPLLVAWWASCARSVESQHHVSAAAVAFTPTIVSQPSSKPPPKATITTRTTADAMYAHVGEGDVLMPLICTSGQAPVQCPPDKRADVQRQRLRRHRRRQCLRRREARHTTHPTTAATSPSYPYASRQPPTHCDQPPGRAPAIVSLLASSPTENTTAKAWTNPFERERLRRHRQRQRRRRVDRKHGQDADVHVRGRDWTRCKETGVWMDPPVVSQLHAPMVGGSTQPPPVGRVEREAVLQLEE